MEDLSNIYISPLPDSPYVKPFRFNYTQNGKEKNWDLLEVHDSVAIIVFNITRNVMVFVKQFRPAVYYNCISPEDRAKGTIDPKKYPASLGISLEMCAGIVDKNIPLDEIAKEEIEEECGYKVEVKNLERVMSYRTGPQQVEIYSLCLSFRETGVTLCMYGQNSGSTKISMVTFSILRSGVGVQGSMQTLYYCEVTDSMKTEQGGGVDDEIIDVVEHSIPEIEEMINSKGPLPSPPSFLFGLMWFFKHKADTFRTKL